MQGLKPGLRARWASVHFSATPPTQAASFYNLISSELGAVTGSSLTCHLKTQELSVTYFVTCSKLSLLPASSSSLHYNQSRCSLSPVQGWQSTFTVAFLRSNFRIPTARRGWHLWLFTKLVEVWTNEIQYRTKQRNGLGTSNGPSGFKAVDSFDFINEAIPGKAAKASDQFSSVLKTVHHAADT